MCHISGVRCHMSRFTCQVSHVTCHMSLFSSFLDPSLDYKLKTVAQNKRNYMELLQPSQGFGRVCQCSINEVFQIVILLFLADLGKASNCSKKLVAIHWFFNKTSPVDCRPPNTEAISIGKSCQRLKDIFTTDQWLNQSRNKVLE